MMYYKREKGILCVCVSLFLFFTLVFVAKTELQKRGNDVIINEVCYNFSVSSVAGGANYVELYNPTEEDVTLSGYYLANNVNAVDYLKLETITIEAEGYKNVYIDEQWSGMDFSTSADVLGAELFSLFLFNPQGEVVDSVDVPQIKYDTSWARVEDGDGVWNNLTATPEASNHVAECVIREVLTAPSFSVPSGFYSENFMLELEASESDCNIYYTLDGSIPDEDDFLYTSPIEIFDPSSMGNQYASLDNFSTGYYLADYDMGTITTENVTKCMVVRSVAYSEDGAKKSGVETRTYFVGDEGKYGDLPVVSLVGDPDDLFGFEKGIYVTGESFDKIKNNPDLDESSWMFWDANYRNKGKAWEREVHMDYFGADRKLILEQEVGARIKGGATRAYPQKSFNLYARNIYGENDFKVPFFDDDRGKRRITLFSGANDMDTKIRDVLVHNLCDGLEFCTMESIPCSVFLNGEYWGMYYITEKFDESYIWENYGVEPTDVLMIKAGFSEGRDKATEDYSELQALVEDLNLSYEENYLRIQQYIDIKSYMEYYATQVYLARCNDWPSGNWAIWKSDEVKESGKYYDGKWRWILFDLNWDKGGMSEWLVEYDVIRYIRKNDLLFDKLMNNEEFKKEFVYVFCNIANINFADDRVQNEIDSLCESVEEYVKRDYGRFYNGALTDESFHSGVTDISTFFEKRKAYIMELVQYYCGVEGACAEVSVDLEDANAGKIIVNRAEVDISDADWQGYYYTEYPISIQAVAKEGYEFAGWSGDIESGDAELTINIPENGMYLHANFIQKK